MKKIFIFSLSIFFTYQNAYSQCKVEIDRFKKDTTIESDILSIGKQVNDPSLSIRCSVIKKVNKVDTFYSVTLIPSFSSFKHFSVKDKIYIEFENDEIIDINPFVDDNGQLLSIGNKSYYINMISFIITEKRMKLFTKNKIKAMKIDVFEYKIDNRDYIIKSLSCIFNTKI